MKDEIELWIKKKVEEAGAKGVVIGLSGGIDSSVVAVLCNEVVPTLGLILPCHSRKSDSEDALNLTKKFNIPHNSPNLSPIFDSLLPELGNQNKLVDGNLKSRLRMSVLYHYANTMNRLVIGTSNKTEILIGYYTKYGDGGVDLEPLGGLYKTEVFELAKDLGIPKRIIEKPPSAGLWEGQTDEEELGISYEKLDKILKLIESTEHKRHMPDICKPY